jgi:hypothetical protein
LNKKNPEKQFETIIGISKHAEVASPLLNS